MKFALEVAGEIEKFTLEYEFNQLLGTVIIKVDNKPVARKRHLFNEPVKEVFSLEVGQREMFAVRIEKRRKMLFGQQNHVYVNDRLIRTFEGI